MKPKTLEVARSYARKVKGDKQYEMIDVFASRKAECSPDDAPAISAWLYQECVKEVEAEIKKLQTKPFDPDQFRDTYREKYHPELPKDKPFEMQKGWMCKKCNARYGEHECEGCSTCGTQTWGSGRDTGDLNQDEPTT